MVRLEVTFKIEKLEVTNPMELVEKAYWDKERYYKEPFDGGIRVGEYRESRQVDILCKPPSTLVFTQLKDDQDFCAIRTMATRFSGYLIAEDISSHVIPERIFTKK
jgi:hypothetical protein